MRLSASALDCRRGGRAVFSGLNFSLERGQALLVTGPNGSGKSSLLRIAAGLLCAEGGALTLEGGDPERSIGEQAHYVGHQDALKPSLTVGENLDFWARYLGGAPGVTDKALAAVGLAALSHLPAGYLSAGQKRRLSLARLAAVARPVWLLDEPATARDAQAQAELAAMMRAHLADGGLILAATHSPLALPDARELRMGNARLGNTP
jgi:heme exporter protein A